MEVDLRRCFVIDLLLTVKSPNETKIFDTFLTHIKVNSIKNYLTKCFK